MGQDYSYTQPSSSEASSLDITSLLQAEAELYADEGDSSRNVAETFQNRSQPEADDGIPRTCYCGGEPSLATSYTDKDPGRRYFTCESAHYGDCHVWKWFDMAVMEELNELQRQLREIKDDRIESEVKVCKLEETVSDLAKKKSCFSHWFPLLVCVVVSFIILITVAKVKKLNTRGFDI